MVKIFFVGDFCSRPSTSNIHVDPSLKEVISASDAALCNFEIPLRPDSVKAHAEGQTPEQAGYFYQNDDAPKFLEELGFSLFSFSNNHVFDCGDDGFLKTKSAFKDPDSLFGSGFYDEAYKLKIIEANGVKIGFLALSYASRHCRFNDVSLRKPGKRGCAYINDPIVNHIIHNAKQEVDYLCVVPHDGIEYIDIPMPETMSRYRDLIDWGADAVVGSHPHCPQGWEVYKEKPIFYSLGNFFFNSRTVDYRANRPHWYEGVGVMLSFDDGKVSYETYNIRNIDNIKLTIDTDSARDQHNRQICEYLKDEAQYWAYFTHTASKQIKRQEGRYLLMSGQTARKQQIRYHLTKLKGLLLGKNVSEAERAVSTGLLQNPTRQNALSYVLKQK